MILKWHKRIGISIVAAAFLAVPLSVDAAPPAERKAEKRTEAGSAQAGVEVGSAVPDFKLTDCAGKEHSLSQYKGKVVVLGFTSHECPWSVAYDPDADALAKSYADKGVVWLNIDSHADHSIEDIQNYCCKDKKFSIPVLKDVDNAYADTMNAKRTPEMYVIDKSGNLAYHGAYDNRKEPSAKGDTSYVKDAIDALLAEQPVKTAKTQAWGCGIKRKA